jgi:hypothetical protein
MPWWGWVLLVLGLLNLCAFLLNALLYLGTKE